MGSSTKQTASGRSDWTITPERFSDLIGAIYDCTMQPERWPQTIAAIAEATNCFAGMIGVADLRSMTAQALYTSGYPEGCVDRMMEHAPTVIGLYRTVPDLTALYDEPISSRRSVPPEMLETSPYLREMTATYGIVDSIDLFLIAGPDRIAELGLSRHESRGVVTDEDLAILRLLAPHIRRSVTISDLLDMKSIEAQALGSTLDGLAVGVVIVGDEGRILHGNEAARRMLAKGFPIVSSGGRLATLQSRKTAELRQAIALAGANEAGMGKAGIGIALTDDATRAATAHVLPLARGDRRRLVPRATAAVFVMPADAPGPMDVALVARMFALTPAEERLLRNLASGADVGEASMTLGISLATAKTHRTRLFAKLGVKRRADLLALLARLVPPLTPTS